MWSLGVSGITSLGTLQFYLTNQAHIVNALQHTTAQYHPSESFPMKKPRSFVHGLLCFCHFICVYISEIKGSLLFLRVGCPFKQWNALQFPECLHILVLSFLGNIFNRQAISFLQKVKQEGIADEGVLFDKVSIELMVNFTCSKFNFCYCICRGGGHLYMGP